MIKYCPKYKNRSNKNGWKRTWALHFNIHEFLGISSLLVQLAQIFLTNLTKSFIPFLQLHILTHWVHIMAGFWDKPSRLLCLDVIAEKAILTSILKINLLLVRNWLSQMYINSWKLSADFIPVMHVTSHNTWMIEIHTRKTLEQLIVLNVAIVKTQSNLELVNRQ